MSKRKNKIKKHLSDEEMEDKLKETKKCFDVHRRLLLIKMVSNGETIKKASENLNVSRKTGERWVKSYNEKGYEGLKSDYSNCGRPSDLSNDDLDLIYQELTREGKNYNIKKAREFINTTFNTNYCYNSIWWIIRVKLKLNYCKPFPEYNKDLDACKNELMMKLEGYDLDSCDLAFVDETHANNTPNTQRILCAPGQKVKVQKPIGKFGISFTGFQGVNCPSYITSNEHSNAYNFIRDVCSYRILQCGNMEAETLINDILDDSDLLEENIINELRLDLPNKKDLQKAINEKIDQIDDVEKMLVEIDKLCKNKINDHYSKISKLQREKIVKKLAKTNIKYVMEKERPLLLVLDNAKIHVSKETKMVFDLLNIIPIYLPPYCPELNPIEDVWRVDKNIIYTESFEDLDELIDIMFDAFYQNACKSSFYENWINEFMV